jgi:hypothetical protein
VCLEPVRAESGGFGRHSPKENSRTLTLQHSKGWVKEPKERFIVYFMKETFFQVLL